MQLSGYEAPQETQCIRRLSLRPPCRTCVRVILLYPKWKLGARMNWSKLTVRYMDIFWKDALNYIVLLCQWLYKPVKPSIQVNNL